MTLFTINVQFFNHTICHCILGLIITVMYFYVTCMYIVSMDFITNKNATLQMCYNYGKNERFRMEKGETGGRTIQLKDKSLFLLWFKTQKDYRHFIMDKWTWLRFDMFVGRVSHVYQDKQLLLDLPDFINKNVGYLNLNFR